MSLKLRLIIIFVFVILVILVITLAILSHGGETQKNTSIIPSTTPVSVNQQPIIYDQTKSEQALHSLVNRQPLSSNDLFVKQKLIISANGDIVYTSSDFTVEYIKPLDQFQVELNSINLGLAKQEAEKWFLSEGLSQTGICTLPVSFEISANVVQQLKTTNKSVVFSPLPDGC